METTQTQPTQTNQGAGNPWVLLIPGLFLLAVGVVNLARMNESWVPAWAIVLGLFAGLALAVMGATRLRGHA